MNLEGLENSKDTVQFMDNYNYIEENTDELLIDSENTEWIMSLNPTEYDVIGAFSKFNKINWHQNRNFKVGDIIYIYVSTGFQEIKYKCKVNKIDLKEPEIDDSEFAKKILKIFIDISKLRK